MESNIFYHPIAHRCELICTYRLACGAIRRNCSALQKRQILRFYHKHTKRYLPISKSSSKNRACTYEDLFMSRAQILTPYKNSTYNKIMADMIMHSHQRYSNSGYSNTCISTTHSVCQNFHMFVLVVDWDLILQSHLMRASILVPFVETDIYLLEMPSMFCMTVITCRLSLLWLQINEMKTLWSPHSSVRPITFYGSANKQWWCKLICPFPAHMDSEQNGAQLSQNLGRGTKPC